MMQKFLIIWLVSILSACSLPVDTTLTELAVEQFHESYNKGSFKTIYANASPDFQDFVPEDKFTRLLKKLRSRLGQHKSSKLISWSSKSSNRGTTIITLIYEAHYEFDDKAKESFTFKVNDGLARLRNFNVASEVMQKSTDI